MCRTSQRARGISLWRSCTRQKSYPWRLSDVIEGSCFVGISFFHEDEARSSTLRTSVAQAFTERGEGFVLRGNSFDWDRRKTGEGAPHLNEEQARALLENVLGV